jgi:hypothetical protein
VKQEQSHKVVKSNDCDIYRKMGDEKKFDKYAHNNFCIKKFHGKTKVKKDIH